MPNLVSVFPLLAFFLNFANGLFNNPKLSIECWLVCSLEKPLIPPTFGLYLENAKADLGLTIGAVVFPTDFFFADTG